MPERPHQLKILLSDDEQEMLREIAERQGLTVSDVIRQFIRREHATTVPTSKPKRK